MIPLYFFMISLLTTIIIVPSEVFSDDRDGIYTGRIDKEHIKEITQPHHNLAHILNNIQYKEHFHNYINSYKSLRSFSKSIVVWGLCNAFEDFIRYEAQKNKNSKGIWNKANNFVNQVKDKISFKYVGQLYSSITHRNADDLLKNIESIREYCYKTLEIPFKLFNIFLKTQNN